MFKTDGLNVVRYLTSFFLMTLAVAVFAEDAAPDPAALRFDIASYTVEGATLLSKDEVNAAVAPFTGKGKDFSDVQHALEALEAAYVKKGFTAVQVLLPEQELANGMVRLRVVESRIGQVTVKGQKYFSDTGVRKALPSLAQGKVPRSKRIARELKLANENPARQLNVVLKAGKQEDQVDAEVQVTDKNPSMWGLSFDNSGTGETGHTRLGLFYQHANLMDADHIGTLQLQVSPQHMNRVRVFGAGYKIPLYASSDSVEFFGGYSNVNSVVGGLSNFQGGGVLFNARYNQLLDRVAGFDPHLTYGFDWRDFKRIEQTQPTQAPLYNEIVVTPLSIAYVADGKFESAATSFDIGLSANVPMSSKGKKESFANYDAMTGTLVPDTNYRIVRFGASHVQDVGGDWQARGALSGQWTRNVLVLGEQIRLGGMNGVRGFTEGSEAGERGARGTLEGYTPEASYLGIKGRALAFFDGGSVSSVSGLKASVTSAGFGLRAAKEAVSFRLDAGRIGKAGTDPEQKKGDWRIHAGVSATF